MITVLIYLLACLQLRNIDSDSSSVSIHGMEERARISFFVSRVGYFLRFVSSVQRKVMCVKKVNYIATKFNVF